MFTKTTMYCKFMLSDDGDYIMCICMRVCTHICMYAHTFVLRMNQIYVCISAMNLSILSVRTNVNVRRLVLRKYVCFFCFVERMFIVYYLNILRNLIFETIFTLMCFVFY